MAILLPFPQDFFYSLRPRSYDRRRRQTARCLRLLVKSPWWHRPSNFQMTSMIRLLLKWWEPGLNAHCHVEKKSHFTGLLPSPKVIVDNFGTLPPCGYHLPLIKWSNPVFLWLSTFWLLIYISSYPIIASLFMVKSCCSPQLCGTTSPLIHSSVATPPSLVEVA